MSIQHKSDTCDDHLATGYKFSHWLHNIYPSRTVCTLGGIDCILFKVERYLSQKILHAVD